MGRRHFIRSAAYAYNDGGYYNSVAVTDAFGKTTKTYYDKLGRECKVLYPDGEYTMTEYDLVGNVILSRDRAGNEPQYTYDSINRLISVSYPDNTTNSIDYSKWDSDNNGIAESDLIIKTDGAGVRTAEYYDKAG